MKSRRDNKLEIYKRNLISFTLVNIFWQMGSTFVIPETSLIFFINYLGASNMIIGLIVPIFMVFSSVPCIIWGAVVKNSPKMRRFLVFTCYATIIPYLIIFLIMQWYQLPTISFVILLLILLMASNLALSLESVSYQNYVAAVVPEKKRGTLWGIVFSSGYIFSLALYPLMHVMYTHLSVFAYYKYGFLIFFIFAFTATQFFWLVKEPDGISVKTEKEKINWHQYFSSCKDIIFKDTNFRNFLLIQNLSNFSICIRSFSIVFMVSLFHITNHDIIRFTLLFCIFFGIGNYIGGKLGDHKGFRFILQLSMLLQSFGAILLILSRDLLLSYCVYAVIVMGFAMQDLAVINIPIDSIKETNKSKYIGISKTLSIPSLLLSIPLGMLVDRQIISLSGIMVISSISLLVTFLLLKLFFTETRRIHAEN